MILIDGSQGEGGGQVLRSALALSILTQTPVHLEKIRAGRSKPGLQPQHLAAVKAAAAVSDAEVRGASLSSTELEFTPRSPKSGRYRFEIGTAGSTALVLQTVFLPLSFAGGSSQVTILGGTHVPFAPSFPYLQSQWLALMNQIGYQADISLDAAGFYPGGGGILRATIRQAGPLAPLQCLSRGALVRIRGVSGVANLDDDIARRQKLQALRRLEPIHRDSKVQTERVTSPGKGTYICLTAEFEHSQACVCALGAPGKRAERVADEAVDGLERVLNSDAALDEHAADQLLLPLACTPGISRFRTSRVTSHLVTQASILQQFGQAEVVVEGESGEPGTVTVPGRLCRTG